MQKCCYFFLCYVLNMKQKKVKEIVQDAEIFAIILFLHLM